MAITLATRIELVPTQSSSVIGTETILLDYKAGNYYELNEVGGFIWALLQAHKTMQVQEIQERLLDEFDVEPSVCEEELMAFLDTLFREKLIEARA